MEVNADAVAMKVAVFCAGLDRFARVPKKRFSRSIFNPRIDRRYESTIHAAAKAGGVRTARSSCCWTRRGSCK